ncbi:hypothetical protein E8E14_006725 [Neopestalotiopsis sp. 37M]|nr:hypothetical protein E8E14_006725 [Neopestalotiopsis sp. 37M]
MLSSRDIMQKFIPDPLPDLGSFKGQAVLITGATSGLGLAAAIHFLNLGASEVIITARSPEKGESAKRNIEAAAAVRQVGSDGSKVHVLILDMNRYSSIVSFVDQLKQVRQGSGGIDYAVLNAGIGAPEFRQSPEGLEEDLQVNAVSTILLGRLILDMMKSERRNRTSPAHLGFVSSGQAANCDIAAWSSWKHEGILAHMSKEENWPGNGEAYNNSKLVALYGIREISKLAMDSSTKRPDVIVNAICPGIVKTDITRDAGTVASIFVNILGKSPEHGARALIRAGLTTEAGHGHFVNFYMTESEFLSEAGSKMQSIIWKEIIDIIAPNTPQRN